MNLADKSDSVNHILVGGFGKHLNDASVCWVHGYKRFSVSKLEIFKCKGRKDGATH